MRDDITRRPSASAAVTSQTSGCRWHSLRIIPYNVGTMTTPPTTHCPECRAPLTANDTCESHFHTLLGWELEYLLYDVHHLLVLTYHLQHPALYSPDMLRQGITMLDDFLDADITPQQMRQDISQQVDSGTRTTKITGTPQSHGSYPQPIPWTMHIGAVVAAGLDAYYRSVRQWARAVQQDIRQSGNASALHNR
jgi:hypothetical protein